MTRRRNDLRRWRCAALACALLAPLLAAAQPVSDGDGGAAEPPDTEHWYRVEVLIFAREGTEALAAEQWEPLPALAYPERYRYLIDPALADERLAAANAFASRFDGRGVQTLVVPRPPAGVETLARPDYLLEPLPRPDAILEPLPDGALEPDAPVTAGAPTAAAAVPVAQNAADADGTRDVTAEPEAPPPLFALPFQQLPREALEFRYQATLITRRGERVLFHGAWWIPLAEDARPVDVVLDHSGDAAPEDWPALQGSMRLYRTRYLHADFDLWLNTDGRYMPDAWTIPAPPLPEASYRGEYLDGSAADPFAEPPALEDLLPTPTAEPLRFPRSDSAPSGLAAIEFGEPIPEGAANDAIARGAPDAGVPRVSGAPPAEAPRSETVDPYPYRHAIRHVQSSRMRGGEIHYLDHPVVGIVLRLTPASEETPPHVAPEARAWRERHGLPVQRVPAPAEDDAAATE